MPSPLLNRTEPERLPEALRDAWDRSTALRGDATLFEIFGNHPDLFRWYAESFYGELFEGGLAPRRLKEVLRLRLSTLHGCRFCNQGNRVDAGNAGLSDAEIDAIASGDSTALPPLERATLELANRLSLTDPAGVLDESLRDTFRAHGLDDAQILELGMLAGLLSGMAKFLFAYDLVEREPECPFPAPPEASNDLTEKP